MKEVPIRGVEGPPIRFFEDDAIESILQQIGLAVRHHPYRLFVQAVVNVPANHYSNPTEWSALFHRISTDPNVMSVADLKRYLEEVRLGSGVSPATYTLEEWEDPNNESLAPLRRPSADFTEVRVFGVPEMESFVIPTQVSAIQIPAGRIPIPKMGMLYSTLYPEGIAEFVIVKDSNAPTSESIDAIYFPRKTSETPENIETLRENIKKERGHLEDLFSMEDVAPQPIKTSIQRIKWYIPFGYTHFSSVRSRFEQMFYGLTMSKEVPYVGYYTRGEVMRHKFYVEDPTTKKEYLDVKLWKTWWSLTQQQRGSALILYRGHSRKSFDRIALTPRDIVITLHRDGSNTKSVSDLANDIVEWFRSLDAFQHFVDVRDIELSRWKLVDMTAIVEYPSEVSSLDTSRMKCVSSIFSLHSDIFRLLRADHDSNVDPLELKIMALLNDAEEENKDKTAIQSQLGIPPESPEFERIWAKVTSEDYEEEKSIRTYPSIRFRGKVALISTHDTIGRVLRYTNILRHILSATAEDEQVGRICPPTYVSPDVGIQPLPSPEETGDFDDFGDFDLELVAGPTTTTTSSQPAPQPQARTLQVADVPKGLHTYFSDKAKRFDPETFDGTYAKNVKGRDKQVVVMTTEEWDAFVNLEKPLHYKTASETERLPLFDEEKIQKGYAVCPPYWCMRDAIPLASSDLVDQTCPVCNGKINEDGKKDLKEYPVIPRTNTDIFPRMSGKSSASGKPQPACYKVGRAVQVIAPKEKTGDIYVNREDIRSLEPYRLARLPESMLKLFSFPPSLVRYKDILITGSRIGEEPVLLRMGIGRPSQTLPTLLEKPSIPSPAEVPDKVKQCSFFRNWGEVGSGETLVDKIIAGIDVAYKEGKLSLLQELEYTSLLLKCAVYLMTHEGDTMICGFGTEFRRNDASVPTLVMTGETMLTYVSRKKTGRSKVLHYAVNIRVFPPSFQEVAKQLDKVHRLSCGQLHPTSDDALQEIRDIPEKSTARLILDPLQRAQALFLPNKVLLPFDPIRLSIAGIPELEGYHAIPDNELPSVETAEAFLNQCAHKGYHVVSRSTDSQGRIVELVLESQFRCPVRRSDDDTNLTLPTEILDTMKLVPESILVSGESNNEDKAIAERISYSAEMFEFLLFSLSKDIATDFSGHSMKEEYVELRSAIEEGNREELSTQLKRWFDKETRSLVEGGPVAFVNKVRTPCGQMTQQDTCSKSTLCGWDVADNMCKIKIREDQIKPADLLRRLLKVLIENSKQRALVLDGRLSPFFSSVLYLEMPNEVIKTSINSS